MKIGITASHGCGKTTLLNALNVEGHYKITEVSRSLIEKLGFNPLVGSSSYWQKFAFEKEIIAEQIRQELAQQDFVTDRTVFDVLAYASTLLNNLDYGEIVGTALAHYWTNPYDLVIFVPIEFPMQSDGVRPESERYRQEIEDAIRTILTNYKVPYVEVRGTVEERIAQIEEARKALQAVR